MTNDRFFLTAAFLAFFAANTLFWHASRHMHETWASVPPAPSVNGAGMGALGDRQFAYRTGALMLQNFGDIGSQVTPLKNYDFPMLGQWFRLEDALDPHSDFAPYIAAYYYSGSQDGKKIGPVVDYLAMVGQRPNDADSFVGKWRWLGQAVYLARFRMGDLPLALKLANELAAMKSPHMPEWTKEMPAFVTNAKGDKQAAYALSLSILKSEAPHMQQAEINSMIVYICTRILNPQEEAANPLCTANAGLLK